MFQPIGIHERKSAGWGTVEESFKETDMMMWYVNDTTFFTIYIKSAIMHSVEPNQNQIFFGYFFCFSYTLSSNRSSQSALTIQL
jgi:hypothetical protein